MSEIERDELSGVETTGHEWDGIRELNLPAPRWWLITFILTVIWGIGYMVVYPAWPTLSGDGVRGGTEGTLGWTQYGELAEQQAEILERRAAYAERFNAADDQSVLGDEELYAYAIAGGRSAFKDNCATCHGTGGAGSPGYPNLNDDDWLWGGSLETIHETIRVGVRAQHVDTRFSEMPAFRGLISDDEVKAVTSHVLSLTGRADANEVGAEVYANQCAFCHGDAGEGMREVGAPALADAIWFYGNDEASVASQVNAPRHGMMPAWEERLSADTIRQLAIYVYSLGGGEAAVVAEADLAEDAVAQEVGAPVEETADAAAPASR